MIELAKEKDGLDFFEELSECGRVKSPSSSSFQSKSVMSNEEQIWFQHRRLGHPSFNVGLKVILATKQFPMYQFSQQTIKKYHIAQTHQSSGKLQAVLEGN